MKEKNSASQPGSGSDLKPGLEKLAELKQITFEAVEPV